MTNPIPKGTCNVTLNLPKDERAAWGRLAGEANQPLSHIMRQALLEWADTHRPEVARAVRTARGITRTSAQALLMLWTCLQLTAGHLNITARTARPPRRPIPMRVARRTRQETGTDLA